MTYKKTKRLINKIMKEDCVEVGIFISLLSKEYIDFYCIDEKDFLKSLKNSLKIIDKEYSKDE